jgi:23S rRNA-/tRNA-specific pseudouridylate synthase
LKQVKDRALGRHEIPFGLPRAPRFFPGVSVLFRSERWLALMKPANLLIHRTRPFSQPNLIDNARMVLGEQLLPVHRLDRVTSGIVILARDPEAAGLMGRLWSGRRVEKRYLVACHRRSSHDDKPGERFVIDAPIGRDLASPIRIKRAVVHSADSAEAQTAVHVLACSESVIWLECVPRTGRTHQLRCHLAHVNLPILGDLIYGCAPEEYLRRAATLSFTPSPLAPESPRLALHAWSLQFQDPTQSCHPPVVLHAAIPEDFPRPPDSPDFRKNLCGMRLLTDSVKADAGDVQ